MRAEGDKKRHSPNWGGKRPNSGPRPKNRAALPDLDIQHALAAPVPEEIEAAAQPHAVTAIAALVKILISGENETAAISAANTILDRGYGKPAVDVGGCAQPHAAAERLRYCRLSAVARKGTVSAAAQELRCTQTTVGRRLASLEARLGVRLLNRTPRGCVATPAGESIREHVEHMEAEAAAVEHIVAGRDARLEGKVTVTCIESIANNILAPCFARLRINRRSSSSFCLLTGM
jgi:hypothetical protein